MSIAAERLKLIVQIDSLEKQHPSIGNQHSCPDPDCELCPQIRELGKRYELLTNRKRAERQGIALAEIQGKANAVFAKGTDATKSDIEFLLNVAKMPKRDIAPKLGMSENTFLKICQWWGIGQINKRRQSS